MQRVVRRALDSKKAFSGLEDSGQPAGNREARMVLGIEGDAKRTGVRRTATRASNGQKCAE